MILYRFVFLSLYCLSLVNYGVAGESSSEKYKTLIEESHKLFNKNKFKETLILVNEAKYFKINNNKLYHAYLISGVCLLKLNQYALAEKDLTEALKIIDRSDIESLSFNYANLGYVYQFKKDYTTAIDYYQKALDVEPEYIDVLVKMTNCHSKLNHFQVSIDFGLKALKLVDNLKIRILNVF